MKKKIAVSFCILILAIGVWMFFQMDPETEETADYYYAQVYIDADPFKQGSDIMFLQKDGQLYISFQDAQELFSVQILNQNAGSIKVSSDGGNFLLTSEKGFEILKREGISYLPFRKTAEKLDYAVLWDHGFLNLISDPLASDFSFGGIQYGSSEAALLDYFGQPDRKDLFSNGTVRYLYALNSEDFFMADIQNGIVCALYSNAKGWTHSKLAYGMSRSEVEEILKDSYFVDISDVSQNEIGIGKVYLMFDQIDGERFHAVCVGEPMMMEEIDMNQDGALLETEMLDILNAERIIHGCSPLLPDEVTAECAKAHSIDMSERDYFDHTNPEGEDIGDRMKKMGISYSIAGENIAAGYQNIIFAHNQLLNSSEHRANLFEDFQYAGIGIAENENSKYQYYYTQNFYTMQMG